MFTLRVSAIGSVSVLTCFLGACSADDKAASDAGTVPPGVHPEGNDAAANQGDALMGAFIVEMFPAKGTTAAYTGVSGKVFDGPTPQTTQLTLLEEGGGCQLFKPRVPFCSTPCGSGNVCVDDDKCAGYPAAQDLGPIQVSGLGSADFALTAISKSYDVPGDLTLPSPPGAEGGDVKLAVTQGIFGAFNLQSKIVAPLSSPGAVTMASGQPLQLTWEKPGQADLARIQVKVDISHHGGTKGQIDCDVPDTGSLEISAALITKLIDLGVAGFPAITLSRVATGVAALSAGKIELRVVSSVTREVDVTGFQSCDDTHPCPTGKTCQTGSICSK